MPFSNVGSLKYFRFLSLDHPDIYHAVFSRHGGISPEPWKSLNFGGSVGDDPTRVLQNREKALKLLDIDPNNIYDVYQIHSTDVVVAERPLTKGEQHIKADAIITNRPRLSLMMRFADCVPILLFDPVRHAIGIAHAGWKGTVNKIAAKVIQAMHQNYGTQPGDILAAIGPSIGPDHYSVRGDVMEHIKQNFTEEVDLLVSNNHEKTFFNLWKANQLVLNEVGVHQVEFANICTSCDIHDWYSHRGEHGKTGRFGIVLGLY